MKQIYNFEQESPPSLNENMLRAEAEKRKLRLQTSLVAVSGILLLAVVVLLGLFVYGSYPYLALLCFLYALVSATGGSVMAVVFTQKGGLFT